ncbi:MAG TPA: hypothetical protein VMJ70_03550 [Candidatus Sulfotelmatobacter sp.]|nr:hypothetical protein [Candidatus Sulfotelmatobacter sp.]
MIADRSEQFEGRATTRPRPSAQRYTPRCGHGVEAPASIQRPARDRVAEAFRALANGVEPGAARAQAATFYRSSGQVWARSLDGKGEPVSRAHVAAAFGAMAHGVDPNARAATLHFCRASRRDWTRGLGETA